MKSLNFYHFQLLFLLLCINTVLGQNQDCINDDSQSMVLSVGTCTPSPLYSYSTDPNVLANYDQLTVQVYFWGINEDDGSSLNPFTIEKAQEAIQVLNDAYSMMNLCFELNGFKSVNDSSLYWTNFLFVDDIITDNNNQYLEPNSLNIIVPYRFTNFNNSLRGGSLGAVFGAIAINSYEYNTGIIVHEVGHEFGLLHTYIDPCEHVTRDPNDPDYNAECAGDRVVDTGSMPNLNNNTTFIDQSCQYLGGLNDCQGTPLVLGDNEIKNFMSYTLQHCRQVFTVGQGIRVRETIANNQTAYDTFLNNSSFNLYSANSIDDIGLEPDEASNVIWESPDIWVRNQNDGFTNQFQEDLEFIDDNTPVYIYVRVRNKSCRPSLGNDTLELFWAKAGLNQGWDDVWEGIANSASALEVGNSVGIQTIPSVEPGEDTILEFQWQPQNPSVYSNAGFDRPWMFSFLSRINSSVDLMNSTELVNTSINTRNNNNIAYNSNTVLNVTGNSDIGSVIAGNFTSAQNLISDIRFFTDLDNSIWNEAEIRVTLDDVLWNAWQNSGAQSTGVIVLDPNTKQIYLTGNDASLNNISLHEKCVKYKFHH
jgi:hypothetical protein